MSLFEKIAALFAKKKEKRIPNIWNKNRSCISWFLPDAGTKVYGFMHGHPKVGDILEADMESGKVGLFEFIKVDSCRDPGDMFFADVKFVGYRDD
jgi:hypothetical protein